MNTIVYKVDPHHPEPGTINQAVEILRQGGLVAFPTETVYGLGANALDSSAVQAIFTAKGRPSQNPLIVHVSESAEAKSLTSDWPTIAQTLSEHFWPGGLTIVLPKAEIIPDTVTAQGLTVAIRVPAHPAALSLLRSVKVPVAAPSANRSNRLSPTRAEHVLEDLHGKIDCILDGGACPGGLESTVLDLTTDPPTLLRPGLISPGLIESVIGPVQRQANQVNKIPGQQIRSPGQLSKHYAPTTQLECVSQNGWQRVTELVQSGLSVGWLTTSADSSQIRERVTKISVAEDPDLFACHFYDALHTLDRAGLDLIIVDVPPVSDDWLAIHDRLQRASFQGDR